MWRCVVAKFGHYGCGEILFCGLHKLGGGEGAGPPWRTVECVPAGGEMRFCASRTVWTFVNRIIQKTKCLQSIILRLLLPWSSRLHLLACEGLLLCTPILISVYRIISQRFWINFRKDTTRYTTPQETRQVFTWVLVWVLSPSLTIFGKLVLKWGNQSTN
jgi:hypothetical protein